MVEKMIQFRKAQAEDAPEIFRVMKDVHRELEDKSLYVCDDFEFVKEHIEDHGFTLVAFNEAEEIVGFLIVRYPMLMEDNLGRDLELPGEELTKVVHMESVAVLPDYRGQGLLLQMLQEAEALIDANDYTYYLTTVSPGNPASYKSFEKNGYRPVLEKKKYGGHIRKIYYKKCERK